MKIVATIMFTVREATGPNPEGKRLELVDDDEDEIRIAYIDTFEEAEEEVREYLPGFNMTLEQVFGHPPVEEES